MRISDWSSDVCSSDLETVLRLLESSADAEFRPVGILDDSGSHIRMKLRGVPILGSTDALEEVVKQMEAKGMRPASLIITESSTRLRGPAILHLLTPPGSLELQVALRLHPPALQPFRGGELDL